MQTHTDTPLQIAQRLRDSVHSLRPGQEKAEHADMLRAANLITAAVPIISECREELFDSHQVDGVVTVTEEIDREAVRALDDMDHWLAGLSAKGEPA